MKLFSRKHQPVRLHKVWGGRLPEGTTELPEGVELRFYCVKIIENLKIKE